MSKLLLLSAKVVVYLLCSFYLLPETEGSTSTCVDPQTSTCRTFKQLECCLVSDDNNTIALSLAFFPVEDNPPEFVTVTYNFGTEQQAWYWSSRTSNFIHPFEVLQFLSLFFNKPEPYYTGTVNINLPSACTAASELTHEGVPNLQLLTQRLKLYATSGSASISLSDTYNAKAYDNVTLRNLINRESQQITNVVITMAVFVVFFSVIIIVLMLLAFLCSASHKQSDWFKKVRDNKPAVLSFTVLSLILNLFILSLDGAAMGFWKHRVQNDIYTFDQKRNLGPIVTVLVVDGLGIISWFVIVIFSGIIRCCCGWTCSWNCCECEPFYKHEFTRGHSLVILSLTLLCPIFCVIAHSPYIAIAYLNDGSHASSIFIYYAVLIYIFYGIMWLFFHWCGHYSKEMTTDAENQINPAGNASDEEDNIFTWCVKAQGQGQQGQQGVGQQGVGQQGQQGVGQQGVGQQRGRTTQDTLWEKMCCCSKITCKCTKVTNGPYHCHYGVIMFLLGITLVVLLGLVVTATCYFVFIPINKSISDAPSRILSIYQSGGFVIGSFIVYRLIKYFYSKKHEEKEKNIKSLVDKLDTWYGEWKTS